MASTCRDLPFPPLNCYFGKLRTLNGLAALVDPLGLGNGDALLLALQDILPLQLGHGSKDSQHRLYVKYDLKRQGIGSALLKTAEEHIKVQEKAAVLVHLGEKEYYFESYHFYPKHGYIEYAPRHMKKFL